MGSFPVQDSRKWVKATAAEDKLVAKYFLKFRNNETGPSKTVYPSDGELHSRFTFGL